MAVDQNMTQQQRKIIMCRKRNVLKDPLAFQKKKHFEQAKISHHMGGLELLTICGPLPAKCFDRIIQQEKSIKKKKKKKVDGFPASSS